MTRVLLAEHSPHAQRMGERILREEGYQVITVTDGETALLRLNDVRPQLLLADVALRGISGLKICQLLKSDPNLSSTRIILTVGALELIDETAVAEAKPDGILRKPFEASALLDMAARLAPLVPAGPQRLDRTGADDQVDRQSRSVVVLDPERVRAAVTVALDEATQPLIEAITARVIAALTLRR